MVQLSHPYMTTGKTTALIVRASVDQVMPLLFNTLSRFVTAFLPRSNRLLISWLQSPSSVISEPKKRKSVTVSTFSLSICQEVMGPDVMILVLFSFVLSFLTLRCFSSKLFMVYFWLHWVLVDTCRPSLVASAGYSLLVAYGL